MSDQENQQAAEMGGIQELIVAGDLTAALKALDELPPESQGGTSALYMRAVCCRHLGQMDNAETHLQTLLANSPNYSRAHQEYGHLLKGLGRAREALAAYSRACRINPALKASWRAQLEILDHATGSNIAEQRKSVARQLQNLEALPGPLLAIKDMLYEGKLLKAENAVRHYLQKSPQDVEAMRVLAEIGLRFGVLEDAEFCSRAPLSLRLETPEFVLITSRCCKNDSALGAHMNSLSGYWTWHRKIRSTNPCSQFRACTWVIFRKLWRCSTRCWRPYRMTPLPKSRVDMP